MSRESAIEAIKKTIEEVMESVEIHQGYDMDDTDDFTKDIMKDISEHGFVHLDDIAEGWIKDEMWSATIREVLSGLAVRKEA